MMGVLSTTQGLEGIRPDWTGLLLSSRADGLFLTWEWARAVWTQLCGRHGLLLLTVRDGGDLAGIAPFVIAPRGPSRGIPFRAIEFLGSGAVGSDYLDLIAAPGREADIADAIAAVLDRDRMVLRLRRVHEKGSATARLAARLRGGGWAAMSAGDGICPYADLRGKTWDTYLEGLGAQHRATFRRKHRALRQARRIRFARVRDESERPAVMAALFRLHHARFSARGGSDALHTPALRAFHEAFSRTALERGWLRLFALWVDDAIAAVVYGFAYRGRFYFYQSGFDPALSRESVGMVALGLSIRDAIEEGLHEYDFLHGDETYKSHWARNVRPLTRFDLYPPSLSGLLPRGIMSVRAAALQAARALRTLPAAVR